MDKQWQRLALTRYQLNYQAQYKHLTSPSPQPRASLRGAVYGATEGTAKRRPSNAQVMRRGVVLCGLVDATCLNA